MKYYTSTIPLSLAKKLKEKGMIGEEYISDRYTGIPKYCEVFDWFIERGWLIDIGREYNFATEQVTERFEWDIEKIGCFSSQPDNGYGLCESWHEAAEKAIENALTLI